MRIIDRLLLKEKPFPENYEKFESKYKYINDNICWLLFLPWYRTINQCERLGLIPNYGHGLIYEGPKSLVGITPQHSILALNNLEKDIEKQMKRYNLNQFNLCIGYSIGTLPASYFTSKFEIDRLKLFAPGARLGENIWEAYLTRWVKNEAISNGIETHLEYDLQMDGRNPIDSSKNFPKDTQIIFGTSDIISPKKNVEKLIQSMKNQPKIIKLPRMGHAITILSTNLII